ncbi:diguanylate cyclase [Thalassospira sp. MA62]|nr:diguanylate cyclase [Thalassospira sp. MA62]
MRLKHVLVVCFILLSAVPLGLSFGSLHSYTSSQYRAQIESKLEAIAELAKQRLLTAIDRINDSTSLLASRTQLRRDLYQFNETGDPQHMRAMAQKIDDAQRGMTRILNIAIFNVDGEYLLSLRDREMTIDLTQISYRNRDIRIMQADPLMVRSLIRLEFENRVVGYMMIDFAGDFILDLVNDRTGLGETGEWLFAVRNENDDAVFAVPLKYDRNASFNRTVAADRTDVPIIQALHGVETIMSNAPDYLEVPVMASTRYIREMDVGLVAKINESEVTAIIEKANQYLLLIAILIILIAMLMGIVISTMIARPLEKLRSVTEQISDGNYNVKPIDTGWREARDLAAAIQDMASSIRDLQSNLEEKVATRTHELAIANQRLNEIASRDPLTGAHNRRFIEERIQEEFDRSSRYGSPVAIAVFDIDHFKRVNDAHGHGAGDEVLIAVAFCVQQNLRTSDMFGRVGGEEFCVVIPGQQEEGLKTFLERLRHAIAELSFDFEGTKFSVTASFGAAMFSPGEKSPLELTSKADKALYKAKDTGRNKVVIWQEGSNISAQ